MFKVIWEKTNVTYQLPEGMVEHMVQFAYPEKNLFRMNQLLVDALTSTLKFYWKMRGTR